MKSGRLFLALTLAAALIAIPSVHPVVGKPTPPAKEEKPASPSPSPSPSPSVSPSPSPVSSPSASGSPAASPTPAPASTEGSRAPLIRWLVQQNGSPTSAGVSWPELIRNMTGKQIVPLDPVNAVDATALKKIGAGLDGLLPKLNKPESPWRSAIGEPAVAISTELHATLKALPGSAADNLASAAPGDASYPSLRLADPTSGKAFYLAVTLYPTGGRESALRAITLRPAEVFKRIATDGCCLLAAIEDNGKSGHDLVLLNWEVIDLAKVSPHCSVTFEADQNSVHTSGATVIDGRKGRD